MALKIVYKVCCDIDVHKTFVVACIASTTPKGVTTYENHRFSTYTKGLKNLLQWLPVTYSLSLGFFMMLWLRLEPAIWLLHSNAYAIEKIRIVFIDEPLTGFSLICDLLFAMAVAANCNFTIDSYLRVDFPTILQYVEPLRF